MLPAVSPTSSVPLTPTNDDLLSSVKKLLKLDTNQGPGADGSHTHRDLARNSSNSEELSHKIIASLLLEIQQWQPLYVKDKDLLNRGTAIRILSEQGMAEVTVTNIIGEFDICTKCIYCGDKREKTLPPFLSFYDSL